MAQQSAVSQRAEDVVYLDHSWTRSDNNLITLPKDLEVLDIAERGEDICWFKEKDNKVLGLGRYEFQLEKFNREFQESVKKIQTVNVPRNLAITIPTEFFDVYTERSNHPQARYKQIEKPYQTAYAEPYHFITTDDLANHHMCLMVDHDRLKQLKAAASIHIRIVKEERKQREAEEGDELEIDADIEVEPADEIETEEEADEEIEVDSEEGIEAQTEEEEEEA